MIERLPAYEGALAARIHQIQEELRTRNPSRAALEKPGAVQVDNVNALEVLAGDEVEVVRV